MKDIYPQTNSEKRMFVATQNAIGAYPNGIIGCQTMSDLAIAVNADCFPVTLKIYGYPVIIGNDLIAFNPNDKDNKAVALKNYANSMLGSFTYPRATTPCSILVNNGVTVCGNSCHAHKNKPESVIYRLQNGKFGIKRVTYSTELPKNTKWAIGGMGLIDMYDPAAEGFVGEYGDVLRRTNHNVLGIKNGKVYGVYYKNLTGQEINAHCKEKMQFDFAILLDGGGLAGINGEESFAKINTSCKQGYIVQFI